MHGQVLKIEMNEIEHVTYCLGKICFSLRHGWIDLCSSAARRVCDESVSRETGDICCPRFGHGCLAFTRMRETHASWFESMTVNSVISSIANDLILDLSDIILEQIKTRWSGIGVTIGRPLGRCCDSWTEAVCFNPLSSETFPTLALIVSNIRICVGGTPWRSWHEQELLCSAAVWLKTSGPIDPCSSVSFNHLYLCQMRPGTEEPAFVSVYDNELTWSLAAFRHDRKPEEHSISKPSTVTSSKIVPSETKQQKTKTVTSVMLVFTLILMLMVWEDEGRDGEMKGMQNGEDIIFGYDVYSSILLKSLLCPHIFLTSPLQCKSCFRFSSPMSPFSTFIKMFWLFLLSLLSCLSSDSEVLE